MPLPCPYLDGRLERRIVAELDAQQVASGLFDDLTAAGFRRSHNMIYRPACPTCSACVPVRIVVERFQPRRSLKRTWRVNRDVDVAVVPARATAEQYALFQRYQRARHGDGDMALMTYADYRALVEESAAETQLLELREPDGTLIGCCLFDTTTDGVSAVYSFFAAEGAHDKRGLGSMIVMALVEHARTLARPYVYLGYWIEACRKMAYKIRFMPMEALGPNGWHALVLPEPQADAAD
ncbi:MAG: arginyltransferase [Alphaproteobacteria bacterium]|nr:arginyltransferase [Alphaproteobacteria bacterium]